jgi:hypothetical protein
MNRRVTQDDDKLIRVVIPPGIPAPVKHPPSSRELARRRAKAEATARAAVEAKALARQVQPGLRSPAGRLFALDAEALILRGPAGGIGTSGRVVRTLEPLAAGGRHPAASLVAAGGWGDELALREALDAMVPKLHAVGLRICRRKAGLRMTKAGPS